MRSSCPYRWKGADRRFSSFTGWRTRSINVAALKRSLGDEQPLYALRARADTIEYDTVEELAADYLREIRAVQPAGPYLFASMCSGGAIVMELTRCAVDRGEEVELAAVIDPRTDFGPRRVLSRYLRRGAEHARSGRLGWAVHLTLRGWLARLTPPGSVPSWRRGRRSPERRRSSAAATVSGVCRRRSPLSARSTTTCRGSTGRSWPRTCAGTRCRHRMSRSSSSRTPTCSARCWRGRCGRRREAGRRLAPARRATRRRACPYAERASRLSRREAGSADVRARAARQARAPVGRAPAFQLHSLRAAGAACCHART